MKSSMTLAQRQSMSLEEMNDADTMNERPEVPYGESAYYDAISKTVGDKPKQVQSARRKDTLIGDTHRANICDVLRDAAPLSTGQVSMRIESKLGASAYSGYIAELRAAGVVVTSATAPPLHTLTEQAGKYPKLFGGAK